MTTIISAIIPLPWLLLFFHSPLPLPPLSRIQERIKKLEQQLQEAQLIAEDSDKKYDIVSMKLSKFEAETERADDRLSGMHSGFWHRFHVAPLANMNFNVLVSIYIYIYIYIWKRQWANSQLTKLISSS